MQKILSQMFHVEELSFGIWPAATILAAFFEPGPDDRIPCPNLKKLVVEQKSPWNLSPGLPEALVEIVHSRKAEGCPLVSLQLSQRIFEPIDYVRIVNTGHS